MSELGYVVETNELKDNVEEIQNKGGEVIICEADGKVIGSACVLIDARLAEGIYAEIVSLVVAEKERAKGIGARLLEEAEIWASQRVNKIRVRANVIRDEAHKFYISKGYEHTKSQKVFIKRIRNN